jgi:hypothetical protein
MATARTIDRLTEDWPEEAGNFELQAFAASVHDGRAELSAPALDRIESTLRRELDRRTARPEQPRSRWQIARRSVGSSLRIFAPYAVAASVLVGATLWIHQRISQPASGPGTPVQMPVEDRRQQLQPNTVDGSVRPPPPAPPQGG